MTLDEFRQRWTKGEAWPATTALDDALIRPEDDHASPAAEPKALSPLRFRPNYVPDRADHPWPDRVHWLARRGLVVVLVFVGAAVVLGLTYQYLPVYLRLYVFDR